VGEKPIEKLFEAADGGSALHDWDDPRRNTPKEVEWAYTETILYGDDWLRADLIKWAYEHGGCTCNWCISMKMSEITRSGPAL